ncbi:MAG TPA: transcriptional regulator [Acidimicrobiia bacterium]|nr:transcriptional regulator [Acidimicrobiia bacterium]
MSQPFEELAELDRLVHEPARLAILTALAACRSADFLYLQRLTGLTKGNLSSHIAKLESAGLVRVDKTFQRKIPVTRLSLTKAGRQGIDQHWRQLDGLRRRSIRWQPDTN